MKKVILTLMTCLFVTSSFAQGQVEPYLYLEEKNGNIVELLFTDGTITILDNQFLIETPGHHLEYEYDDVESFYFSDKNVSVENLKTFNLKMYVDDYAVLHIVGDEPLGKIAIYDITGKILRNETAETAETAIDLSMFAKGIYIVNVKDKSLKIIK
jgi:hypothetical protein